MADMELVAKNLKGGKEATKYLFKYKEEWGSIFSRPCPQPAHDVPGTSLEGPLKVLTSGNDRGLSGDQHKN